MSLIRNKDGALELSIGTIVVIVIGMSMLILGLVLVRTIFTGSTEAVDVLNEKVQGEIVSLFAAEGSDVVIKLGSDRVVKVKKGEYTTVGIGARKSNGDAIESRNDLKYTLSINQAESGCSNPDKMFALDNPFSQRSFDSANPSAVFAAIEIKIPEDFSVCTQKVFVEVKDPQTNDFVGSEYFIIEVIKSGIF
jgi:hypothetical protein